jgi:hypothetical protein
MLARLRFALLLAPLAFSASLASAVDTADIQSADANSEATPEAIKGWVADLESAQFATREEATRQLQAAGTSALDAVVEVATSGSPESSRRAFDILKAHHTTGDDALKTAAKARLETLAKSDNARVARRAKGVLEPPQNQVAQAFPGGGIRVMPLQGGNIQIQAGGQIQIAAGGGGRVVQVQQNNNGRTIKVTEGDKKVEIQDDGKGGDIKIEATEKVEGKDKTEKYEAKNLEELKKNHPEGAKLYEKYSQNGGGIQIRAIQIQPGQLPNRFNPVPIGNVLPAREADETKQKAAEEIDLARKQLDQALEDLKKAGAEGNDALDAVRKQIEAASKKLQDAREKLDD